MYILGRDRIFCKCGMTPFIFSILLYYIGYSQLWSFLYWCDTYMQLVCQSRLICSINITSIIVVAMGPVDIYVCQWPIVEGVRCQG
jgi:hypothetical protein